MKLNLGCGIGYADGWTNVDLPAMPHRADQRLDVTTDGLPWSEVTHAYAGHVLEHIDFAEVVKFLRRLRKCMAQDGVLLVVSADVDVADRMAEAGTFDYRWHSPESLRAGAAQWPGDEHRWEPTEGRVLMALSKAGWSADVVPMSDVGEEWPVVERHWGWQIAVRATP